MENCCRRKIYFSRFNDCPFESYYSKNRYNFVRMYKYLFGPVPSRRLGMSLGVDLVPRKVCSLDCVYCEVGKTTCLTTERKEYIPYNKVVAELEHYFKNSPYPDYITFSGSGEPTLNSRLGDIIKFIKSKKPSIPIAVLTNGTLMSDVGLQEELMQADLVLPSLDAATAEIFKKINRPARRLNIENIIQGLADFSNKFNGKIWLEVFLLPGYNYDDQEIAEIGLAINRIKPDSVQLNTLDRPGTEKDLHSASRAQMERIKKIWGFESIDIIAAAPQRKNIKSYRSDNENAILGTISRRPCTVEDMCKILGMHINEVNKYLDVLEAEGKIESVTQDRGVFYQLTER